MDATALRRAVGSLCLSLLLAPSLWAGQARPGVLFVGGVHARYAAGR